MVEERDDVRAPDRPFSNDDEADGRDALEVNCLFADDAHAARALHRVREERHQRREQRLLVRRDRRKARLQAVRGRQGKKIRQDARGPVDDLVARPARLQLVRDFVDLEEVVHDRGDRMLKYTGANVESGDVRPVYLRLSA